MLAPKAAVAALLALLAPLALVGAEDLQPWQRPGNQAGEEVRGPNGHIMVWVPPGEFLMGSDDGREDERPVHRVRISRGFWLSKFEVTISQWLRYCREAQVLLRVDILAPALDYPMSGVSWHDVKAYCDFYGLSMPTEAQWEWAARGPDGRKYPWGNYWDETLCCNKANPGPEGFTCPVGAFAGDVSWCGARDMAGNLAEWCLDWYAADYYSSSPDTDPRGPESGEERVQRGGYCWSDPEECRGTRRSSDDPANDGGSGTARPCYTP